eukprot:TRINITY_DN10794_c0_g2_i1.p1 TRINITY_DN10794_c0_g2~~TRINITY_DN10794_c0_g2_i1.p1  ORF type:complete len:281 (-),score=62.79 TRINITY_DN10794_c0_g2_i1:602-1444(-)
MLRSLVGSEMCIRDRYQRRVRGHPILMARPRHQSGSDLPTSERERALPMGPAVSVANAIKNVHREDRALPKGPPSSVNTAVINARLPRLTFEEEELTERRGPAVAVIVGSLAEGGQSFLFDKPTRLPGGPHLSQIGTLTCDGSHVFTTTLSGKLHQWFVTHGELAQCDQSRFHDVFNGQVLKEDEKVCRIRSSSEFLFMLTSHGRVLEVGDNTHLRRHGEFLWEGMTRDVTPKSSDPDQGRTSARMSGSHGATEHVHARGIVTSTYSSQAYDQSWRQTLW